MNKDNASKTLSVFINAGLAGRDDVPLEQTWQDTDLRPREYILVLKDLELADPFDDQIREVLPSLAATQRADPFFGPIFGYLEVALSDHGCRRQCR